MLQVVQVGAQNHNTTGLPANWVKSIVPPPTAGAENCNAAGAAAFGATVTAGLVLAALVSAALRLSPHAVNAPASASAAIAIRVALIDIDRIGLA